MDVTPITALFALDPILILLALLIYGIASLGSYHSKRGAPTAMYVNGVPVCIIDGKSYSRPEGTWLDATGRPAHPRIQETCKRTWATRFNHYY